MDAFLTGASSSRSAVSVARAAGEGTSSSTAKPIPWVEKYRPKTIDDVAFQDEVVSVLRKIISGSDLPNLLFYGPPGTGKTSTILAVARQLFGDLVKDRLLELNASDERGINVIRTKVKDFSELTATGGKHNGKPIPPYKLVVLDEADAMTNPAQAALRRTMEKQTRTTRFCLICNYVSRIIEPIKSRCAKFRFKPLSADVLRERLQLIAGKEEVNCESVEVFDEILQAADGDLRRAITFLQSAHKLKSDEPITIPDIHEITGVIPAAQVEGLLTVCRSNSFEMLDTHVKDVMLNGYSAGQLLTQLHDLIVNADDIGDSQKSVICEKIAAVDQSLMDGAEEYLQIMDLCCLVMKQLCSAS